MKNPEFDYRRPETVTDALDLLAEHGDEAKVLAGGQSLLPLMGLRLATPAVVIDIGRLPGLDRIEVADDGSVSIGAGVTHVAAEENDDVARHAPLVHQAMPFIGHTAIRNRGTVCGSIAHADPAAELPAVMLAIDAIVLAASTSGEREIRAADFFRGYLDTALRDDEMVLGVRLPPWPSTRGWSFLVVGRRHADFAIVGLAATLDVVDGWIAAAALAFSGIAGTPQRIDDAESLLVGRAPDDASVAAAAEIVRDAVRPSADIHATASYRTHLAGVLTRRALAAATNVIGVAT
ncbi:MAG: xanthine dehydrogenase family protein subunit M [Acidimicrobiia bacterium]|nr:xanthine dehydrogenase family protein subunit M [Acidimicrobiia bacterium]